MASSVTTIAITIINSTSVNPAKRRSTPLPLRIGAPVRRLLIALGVNIKYILAAPARALRVILHAAQTPLRRTGERVFWDAPQKLHLHVRPLASHFHPVHQRLQTLRIAEPILLLRAELILVGHVLVLIDRRAHLMQRDAQISLLD